MTTSTDIDIQDQVFQRSITITAKNSKVFVANIANFMQFIAMFAAPVLYLPDSQ